MHPTPASARAPRALWPRLPAGSLVGLDMTLYFSYNLLLYNNILRYIPYFHRPRNVNKC